MVRIGIFKRCFAVSIIGILVLSLTGCGAIHHSANFESGFLPKPDTKIKVGTVVNETGQTFDIDIPNMLAGELSRALKNEGLLWTEGLNNEHLIISCKIVGYEKGNALKRWLVPGWGSTALSVQCDLNKNTSSQIVGSVNALHSVSAGGLYSANAWKTVFTDLSKDVTKDLRSKIGR
jgi:hypothetical protein